MNVRASHLTSQIHNGRSPNPYSKRQTVKTVCLLLFFVKDITLFAVGFFCAVFYARFKLFLIRENTLAIGTNNSATDTAEQRI